MAPSKVIPNEQGHSERRFNLVWKDIEFTHVISANGINFLDFVAECHCLVNDKLKEVMRGRFPRQKLKLSVDSATPGRDNPESNLPGKSATWRLVGHTTHDYCPNWIQI